MPLLEKLLEEKSVEKFKGELGGYLSDKRVRVYGIPYKGKFPLDEDFSSGFIDKNTIYFYKSYDEFYVELGLSGNILEKELQNKALWNLKRYSPFIRHNRLHSREDLCNSGVIRMEHFDIDKENIRLISTKEFSELLYSTVKRYVGLQKKYRDEINEFAVMERGYKNEIAEKEKNMERKIKTLEDWIEKEKNNMNVELKNMHQKADDEVQRNVRKFIDTLHKVDGI